ncbi:hypothetical protein [Mycolicibacterium hodleri]|uniref:Uncharacterized protein n=1 Tax=Mycolicibacterium hodleri TaxID=49897 RepID=A0A502DRN3_9MYCO|nr:hypothetical protein [Mycolicibacterium hodleri]TPG28095.1 hypothetical protein EAH80_28625 [Mycolicibacterium hodleri]
MAAGYLPRMVDHCFAFRFARSYQLAAFPFGVTPSTCDVQLGDDRLVARFGPWRTEILLQHITNVSITGPYGFVKTAGPPHLTFGDRGLTFATNGDRGVFIEARVPFRGIEPIGVLRHPNLTITVADCDALSSALRRHGAR